MTAAVIVASGSSRRMGFDKLLAPLAQSCVLAHSIAAFDRCPAIGEIIVVTDPIRFQGLDLSQTQTPFRRVEGGAERQHSVAQGLAALSPECETVAIHDGARPLITSEAILLVLAAAAQYGAAALAHPITETLKKATDDAFVTHSLDRENLWAMETPQCFRLPLLLEAYRKVAQDKLQITDEVSALQHLGHPVKLVTNPSPNPKITFPRDLEFAERFLNAKDYR